MRQIEFRCEKCGALPPKDESKSNENWNVYNIGKGCKCGGRFVTFFKGKKVADGVDQASNECEASKE